MKSTIALAALLTLLSLGVADAATITLPPLGPLQVLGVQCGAGTVSTTATGFDGAYATTYTDATTRCGGSGRGGGYKTKTYHGCAIARYTLTGQLRDHIGTACTAPSPTAIFTTDTGYGEATVSGKAVLILPAVTPTYSWTGVDVVQATLGEPTEFTAAIGNAGTVPLHVYSVSAAGSGVSATTDPAACAEVDLAPGESCPFVVSVYAGNEDVSTATIGLTADTSSLTSVTFSQPVRIAEPPAPPPPPPPTVIGDVAFGASACDGSYVCAFAPADQTLVVDGQWNLGDWSLTLDYADGTTDVAQLWTIDVFTQPDATTYFISGTSVVLDADGNIGKTIAWTLTISSPDGVSLSLVGGTLTLSMP